MTPNNDTAADLETRCLSRPWFYPFRLASGRITDTYLSPEVALIHQTRTQMLQSAVHAAFGDPLPAGLTAADLACHEGWFSQQVAAMGFSDVQGFDARPDHVADAQLAAAACGYNTLKFSHKDVHEIDAAATGRVVQVRSRGQLYPQVKPGGARRQRHEGGGRLRVRRQQRKTLHLSHRHRRGREGEGADHPLRQGAAVCR